ncbi:MAG: methyl-accepting chemotaxis protein [Sulfurospirillaceae bacterium]|nr:methyl-accepting chemotaxis protein [Sulfurospirillaceae bacterium]
MSTVSIKIKTLVLFILSIILVAGVSLMVTRYETSTFGKIQLHEEENLILDYNKNELKAYTTMAEKAISSFYEMTSDANIGQKVKADALVFKKIIEDIYNTNKDKLSKEELRTLIINVTNGYRYNNDVGYFYAYTPEGVNVIHPANKNLVGKNLYDLKDKNGVYLIRDIVKAAKEKESLTKYIWPNPKTKIDEDKISYNFYFEPLDLVFGTGDYASSIKEHYQNEAIQVLQKLRYAEDGYFYAMKKDGKGGYAYAFHGINHAWVDKEIKIDSKDSQGRPYRQQLIEGATKNMNDGVFVTYNFAHPVTKKDAPKLAYAKHFKEWDWIIVSGVYIDYIEAFTKKQKEHISENISHMMSEIIMYGSLIALFAVILIYFLLNAMVAKPLVDLKNKAHNLAEGDGDLTKQLDIKSEDEIGNASKEINNFIEKVRSTIALAKTTSSENASIAHELSVTTLEVGKRVESSMNIISQATTMSHTIKQEIISSVEEAKKSKEEVLKSNKELQAARHSIQELGVKVETSASTEMELAQRIQQLSNDAEQVKNVLTVISDIADQTNLLALNAAIEAARAGEHGRGFAVVADEVRKLAERTQKSLVEINATINVIVQAISDSSEQMNRNSNEVQELTTIAKEVEDKINSTVTMMNIATNLNDKTVADYIQTGEKIDNIVLKIEEINTLSTDNTRSVEEIAGASEHLNAITEKLNEILNKFRT